MKKAIALVLICILLSGCTVFESRMLEPVTFYYLKADYVFGREGSVMVSEQREASGHRDDLSYLLALYLMGPTEEGHATPLPAGTRIFKLENDESTIRMKLSQHAHSLSDSQFSLACGCITMTCLELTSAEQVTITDGERTVTMQRESITLLDDCKANSQESAGEENP